MPKAARAIAIALSTGATSLTFALPALAQSASASTNQPAPPEVPASSDVMVNRGLQFGARFGYAFGSGDVYTGLSVQDGSHGALPIIVDLGWRVVPELYLGVYGQYAYVFTRNNQVECFNGFNCDSQDYRFGVQADIHPFTRARLDPYAGIGFGYEILHTHNNGPVVVPTPAGPVPGTLDLSVNDRGWEFVSLVLGCDYRVDRIVGLGVFGQFSLGEYNVHTGTQTVTVNGATVSSGPVPDVDHGLHELYIVGIRGTFNPMTW
jgi:hypothetical protein